MSHRYEIPPEDLEQRKRREEEQLSEWEDLVRESLEDDRQFLRWRRTYWEVTAIITALVFGGLLYLTLEGWREGKASLIDFAVPVNAALAVGGAAAIYYSRRVRKLALRHAMAQLDRESPVPRRNDGRQPTTRRPPGRS